MSERKPRSRERGKGKKGTHRVILNVSCQPEEKQAIKDKAEKEKITVSKLVIKAVLGDENNGND